MQGGIGIAVLVLSLNVWAGKPVAKSNENKNEKLSSGELMVLAESELDQQKTPKNTASEVSMSGMLSLRDEKAVTTKVWKSVLNFNFAQFSASGEWQNTNQAMAYKANPNMLPVISIGMQRPLSDNLAWSVGGELGYGTQDQSVKPSWALAPIDVRYTMTELLMKIGLVHNFWRMQQQVSMGIGQFLIAQTSANTLAQDSTSATISTLSYSIGANVFRDYYLSAEIRSAQTFGVSQVSLSTINMIGFSRVW